MNKQAYERVVGAVLGLSKTAGWFGPDDDKRQDALYNADQAAAAVSNLLKLPPPGAAESQHINKNVRRAGTVASSSGTIFDMDPARNLQPFRTFQDSNTMSPAYTNPLTRYEKDINGNFYDTGKAVGNFYERPTTYMPNPVTEFFKGIKDYWTGKTTPMFDRIPRRWGR